MAAKVDVKGLRELVRAFELADKQVAKGVRAELRQVGSVVASDARARFAGVDARSAAGFKPRVRRGGSIVVVAQSRRRRSGLRPDFGAKQMREALLPALMSNADEVERRLERLLDRLAW